MFALLKAELNART